MFYPPSLERLSPHDAYLFNIYGRGASLPPVFPTVHSAFLHHAKQNPHLIAVEDFSVSPRRAVTYAELAKYAAALRDELRNQGVRPGTRVPIIAKRSIGMVVGILAILMAGAQYVPLDGGVVPEKTLRHVVRECGEGQLLVCMRSTQKRLESLGLLNPLHVIEDSLDRADGQSGEMEDSSLQVGDELSGCYVVYTSGTTGTPKGVDVTHGNVTNLICSEPGNLGMRPGLKVGSLLSVSFDMGQWEILGSLANGATLILRGSDWTAVLKEINILICTPTILGKYKPSDYPNIQRVATAGEPMPQKVADLWASETAYYNCCGPTEVTIVNTMHLHVAGTPLSIGTPTPNNNVYILDEDMEPVPIGQSGVMWGGGKCVTKGYIGLPEKTAEKYQIDKFMNDGSMMYNTGDLGRWNEQGSLEVLGRIDDQVKIKGFRVELDGVTSSLQSCNGVRSALATVIEGELRAFVTPTSCNLEAVKEQMTKLQPYYAVPTRFHSFDEFPMTLNGKVDKRALQTMISAQQPLSLTPPSTPEKTLEKDVDMVMKSITSKWSGETLKEMAIPSIEKALAITKEAKPLDSPTSTAAPSSPATSISDVEKSPREPDLLQELPAKASGRRARGLRHRVFIVYRRLFSLIWLANMAFFIVSLLIPEIDRKWWGYLASINLTMAIMVRQDHVINTLFTICSSLPRSWPLVIRTKAAKIFHIGGTHSGAASSAVFWFLASTINNVATGIASAATITMSFLVLTLLFSMAISAYPTLRKKFHDRFELIHRLAGWAALALIWAQTVLLTNDTRGEKSLSRASLESPNIWLLVIITLCIASSWGYLYKYSVQSEVLSTHAVRLHFDYTTPVNGSAVRLSERPLLEWHAFATIPEKNITPQRPKGFSVVVSRAGDWTGRQIDTPPTKMWVRGVPACGVMRISTLFNRLIVVATGSGIGPCLGYIQSPPANVAYRVIWSTPSPEKSFGTALCDSIRHADPDCIIHDTRTMGRPDLVKMAFNTAKNFRAEGVIIIANEKITKKVVYGLETRGVAAYGAIWDS